MFAKHYIVCKDTDSANIRGYTIMGIIKNGYPVQYCAEQTTNVASQYFHETDEITTFLNNQSKYWFICGLKGTGKTFLLKAKEQKRYTNLIDKGSYIIIPTEKKGIDSITDLQLTEDLILVLTNENTWQNIWIIAIGLSVISYLYNDKEESEFVIEKINSLPRNFSGNRKLFDSYVSNLLNKNLKTKENPSFFLSKIIETLNINIINQGIFSAFAKFVYDLLYVTVKNGCVIFLDTNNHQIPLSHTDENCNQKISLTSDLWHNLQLGLIRAVYNICSASHHIKIFATIREEVLIRLEETDLNYLRYENHILFLRYNKSDLKQIVAKHLSQYISINKGNQILNYTESFSILPNSQGLDKLFNYIYINTIPKPRDLIYTISKLSSKLRESQDVQKDIINISSKFFKKEYINDFGFIFNIDIHYILNKLQCNVITFDQLLQYCYEYCNGNKNMKCNNNCGKCSRKNIFYPLFYYGLIGIIKYNPKEEQYQQYFNRYDETDLISNNVGIPDSYLSLYLIHPIISYLILTENDIANPNYHEAQILIGHGNQFSIMDLHIILKELYADFDFNSPNCKNNEFILELLKLQNSYNDHKNKEYLLKDISLKSEHEIITCLKMAINEKFTKNIAYNPVFKWLDIKGNNRININCLNLMQSMFPEIIFEYEEVNYVKIPKKYELYNKCFVKKTIRNKNSKEFPISIKKESYDFIASILFINEIDPLDLPIFLNNLIMSLNEYGGLLLIDIDEPYFSRNTSISWSFYEISQILIHVFGIKIIQQNIYPINENNLEIKLYSFFINKGLFYEDKYIAFCEKYNEFLKIKLNALYNIKIKLLNSISSKDTTSIYPGIIDSQPDDFNLNRLNTFLTNNFSKEDNINAIRIENINRQINTLQTIIG